MGRTALEWFPTKGGSGAPDDLAMAPATQAPWLAVSDDAAATVPGQYFYHQEPREAHGAARDRTVHDGPRAACSKLTGTDLP